LPTVHLKPAAQTTKILALIAAKACEGVGGVLRFI